MSEARFDETDVSRLLTAARFAAEKHRFQKRKGARELPYINHPIGVAEILWRVGEVRDVDILVAAILHDTIEDTETTPDEVEEHFGPRVRSLVLEVTDDKGLTKEDRKRLQIERAPHKTAAAKQIKLADKLSNVYDVAHDPPSTWDHARRVQYLDWADAVVAGLRGANGLLEAHYDEIMTDARAVLGAEHEAR